MFDEISEIMNQGVIHDYARIVYNEAKIRVFSFEDDFSSPVVECDSEAFLPAAAAVRS